MSGSGPIGGSGDWLRSGVATVLADLNNQGVYPGQQIFGNASAPLLNNAPALLGGAQGNLGQLITNQSGLVGNLPQQTQNNFANLVGQGGFGNAMTNAGTQGLASAGDSLLNYAANVNNTYGGQLAGLGNTGGMAGQVFAGGGWTPQYQQGFNQLSNFLGQGTPGLQTSAGQANSLIGNTGANGFNQALQQYALQAAGNGGMTPTLSMLTNPMQGIINNQGNNAQSAALMRGAGGLLGSQGQTALTQGLANQGMNLFDQQALMTPAEAVSLARNQAATNAEQQAQQMEQQALARGGGPGAVVANGMQNQGMSDFANQIAQQESQAQAQALQQQQQLQLQQQQFGGQAAQGAGGLQNSLLGTAGGLAGQSGSLANNLFLQGMGLAPTSQNAATNYLNAYLGGGGIGSQNQLGMLGAGSNLAQMLQSGQLGGINALTGMMGAQNQYALGAGGLQNNIANNLGQLGLGSLQGAGNLYNNVFSQGLGQGQLGGSLFSGLQNAINQNVNAGTGYGTMLNNTWSNAANPLLGIAQGGLDLTKTGLGGQAGLFGGMGNAIAQSSQQGAGTVLGGLSGGLGSLAGLLGGA